MFPTPTKRLVRSKSGLRIVAQHERDLPHWSLEEPHWVKDDEVTQCFECKAKFDFVKRRHHCRRCGRIFCARCCKDKVQFHRMGFVDPVRLCAVCAVVTKKEKEFFDKRLKVLFQGAPFHIRSSLAIAEESFLYNCRLSSDERTLQFDGHESDDAAEAIQGIDLGKVLSLQEGQCDGEVSLLTIRVKEVGTGEETEYFMDCPKEPSRKPSILWMSAFRQGMRMVFESRSICRDDTLNEEEEEETASPDTSESVSASD